MMSNTEILMINDDGPARVYIVGAHGRHLAKVTIEGVSNRDWEDITLLRHRDEWLMVMSETGDNLARYGSVRLYFAAVPLPQDDPQEGPWDDSGDDWHWPTKIALRHQLELTYPDGPRDAESLAWDAHGQRLLVITKRDHPPRIYTIAIDKALSLDVAQFEFAGTLKGMRQPTKEEHRNLGLHANFIAQPTGVDISPDGRTAAIITYRSVYLYSRAPEQTWLEAFSAHAVEIVGPPGWHQEAVGFEPSGRALMISGEGKFAPIHRLSLESFLPNQSNNKQSSMEQNNMKQNNVNQSIVK